MCSWDDTASIGTCWPLPAPFSSISSTHFTFWYSLDPALSDYSHYSPTHIHWIVHHTQHCLGAADTQLKTSCLAPASPSSPTYSPSVFSTSLFSLLSWTWPPEFCLGWAGPYPRSTVDTCSFIFSRLLWQTTLLGQVLSYVFMWCQLFKFTSAVLLSFLLWKVRLEPIITTIIATATTSRFHLLCDRSFTHI